MGQIKLVFADQCYQLLLQPPPLILNCFQLKVLDHDQHEAACRNEYNFDHPDAFDFDLAVKTLKRLKEGRSVQVPIYDFTSHSRLEKQKTVYGANVVIFEGIMTFVSKELLEVGETAFCVLLKECFAFA